MQEQDPRAPLSGVGVVDMGPRTARARTRRAEREARRPLVRVDRELRVVALVWTGVGIVCVLAAVLLGSLDHLSPLEFWATLFALFLPPLGTAGARLLGRRTPMGMVYRVILDRAPSPPAGRDPEPPRRTAARAGLAAVCFAVGMFPFVAGGLAFELAAMGKPTEEIPNHLAEAASLVDGVWLLACAVAAAQIGRWVVRWEANRGRAALCPPLHSGLLSPVYYATGGRPPALFPEPAPRATRLQPARPSRGTGAGSDRPGP